MTNIVKKEYIKNETLTKKYQGCSANEVIDDLLKGKIVYSHCIEFGRYIRDAKLKLTINKNFNVFEVWDIVYINVEV